MVEFLLGKGASVNAMDNDNHTPWYYANRLRYDEVEKLLKAWGGT
jgi:ankyrin repeat protein